MSVTHEGTSAIIEAFVCIDLQGGIAKRVDGKTCIPWKGEIRGDQKKVAELMQPRPIMRAHMRDDKVHYEEDIESLAVIVGVNTMCDIPIKPDIRYHVVSGGFLVAREKLFAAEKLTSQVEIISASTVVNIANGGYDRVIVLGGASIYRLTVPIITRLHITQLYDDYECDDDLTFTFPPWINYAHKSVVYVGEQFTTTVYSNIGSNVRDSYEQQYLAMVRNCIEYGDYCANRTGTNTLAIFGGHHGTGATLCAYLDGGRVPLLTTKQMGVLTIFNELLWFLSGNTNNAWLRSRNVKIWESDAQRWGKDDLGKIYGYQWRRFDGKCDQVAECIRLIKNDPTSRRILISSWNPAELDEMALPPCHVLYQFHVRISNGLKYLSCKMYQRSADLGLGVPFNIASTSLLCMLIARVTGCIAEKVEITFGNAHVYEDHLTALRMQTTRGIFQAPYVEFANDAPMSLDLSSMDQWNVSHIRIRDYQCHPAIPMHMSGGV